MVNVVHARTLPSVVRRALVVGGIALTAAVPLATAAPSAAQQFYTGTTITVPPTTDQRVPQTKVVRTSNLAFTGADIAQLVGLGVVAVGVGGMLVRRGRERQQPAPVPGGDGAE